MITGQAVISQDGTIVITLLSFRRFISLALQYQPDYHFFRYYWRYFQPPASVDNTIESLLASFSSGIDK